MLARRQEYQQKGHVLNVRLSDGLLKARIKGSSNQIYDVHIDLKVWPERPGRCSFQYRINCKHAAACLFELAVKEQQLPNFPTITSQNNAWHTHSSYSVSEEVLDADEVEWYSDIDAGGHDFFSYQLGILVDNKTVSLVPLIVDLISRIDHDNLESLPDHKLVKLPISQGKVLQITLDALNLCCVYFCNIGTRRRTKTQQYK